MLGQDEYDSSWDLVEDKKGNLPKNEESWDKKYQEWQNRDWMKWLKENLTFPFMVERKEDDVMTLVKQEFYCVG